MVKKIVMQPGSTSKPRGGRMKSFNGGDFGQGRNLDRVKHVLSLMRMLFGQGLVSLSLGNGLGLVALKTLKA